MAFSAPAAHAMPMTFDVSDGLFANIPAGATGGMATQMGADNWFYKYDPTARFGQMGSSITRDPSTFNLMELGSDGTSIPYGWAADAGQSINNRPVFRNGSAAGRFPMGGTTQGDGVWANAENGNQLALEWRAPGAGTVDADFDLIGRDHEQTDIEWHLATWDGMTWSDLGFVLVTQSHTPMAPATLSATGLALEAGESVYLYGQIADHDAFDGTVITGGITFTPESLNAAIPEPATATLAVLGLAALARRRRRVA